MMDRRAFARMLGRLPSWRTLVFLAIGIGVIGFGLFWLITVPAAVPASALAARAPCPQDGQTMSPCRQNGETMFHAGLCVSCHGTVDAQNKVKHGNELGGGLGMKTPVGRFYVPNISPDRETGIGNWTEAQFITAMVKGTSPDGRHYFPAFPYTSYQRMRHDDLRDMFAYLKNLPPVSNKVRGHDVPFPFNVRRVVGVWKLLFLDGSVFQDDPSKSTQWNRGAYLVNGPSHCAECHSPRNLLMAIKSGQRFAGGPSPSGGAWVSNITQHGDMARWSEDGIAGLLKGNSGYYVEPEMEAVLRNTAQLSDEDRKAMAVYIKSLPPIAGPRKPDAN